MNKIWFFILIFSRIIFSKEIFNKIGGCLFFDNGREIRIQCPFNFVNKGIIFLISEDKVMKIDCYEMEDFRISLLPNISVPKINQIELISCPLPIENFKTIFDHFKIETVTALTYESFNRNVSLTRNYFDCLNNLKKLKIKGVNFLHLSVFDEIRNLHSLEINKSNNFKLMRNLFCNLQNLKELYLMQNQLQEIPDGIFEYLNNLKYLYLLNNNIKTITNHSFYGLWNLTKLELSINNIDTLETKAFHSLRKLSSLNLSGNRLTTISRDIFRNNKQISTIFISYNKDLQPGDYLFSNFEKLTDVDLSFCNLRIIPENIFRNSTNISIINLKGNQLTYIPPSLFHGLIALKKLFLGNNFISAFRKDPFRDLINLEQINLENNKIVTVEADAFINKLLLRKISLFNNKITGKNVSLTILKEAPNLEHLNLKKNLITNIENVVFPDTEIKLISLDLSQNFITSIELSVLRFSKNMIINLDENKIRTITCKNLKNWYSGKVTVSLEKNNLECDCKLYELIQFLNVQNDTTFDISFETLICNSPLNLKGQKLWNLSDSDFICPIEENCPKNCFCFWRAYDEFFVIDCSFRNLTTFPFINQSVDLFSQIELDLRGNDITIVGRENLRYFKNISKLFLSYNEINTIEWLPPKLEVLHLDNNNLNLLNDEIIFTLNNSVLKNLTISNNRWICDCRSNKLKDFLLKHLKLIDPNTVKCYNSNTILINLSLEEFCRTNLILYILIILLISLLIVIMSFLIFYRFRNTLKIWLFSYNLCSYFFTKDEGFGQDKIYDVYISCSFQNEAFVVQNLLPELKNYKVCLCHKNWDPGEFVTMEAMDSIFKSRRTLIILSQDFLENVWSKMEFRIAHIQTMTEGKAKVIIILYEDVDIRKLDNELKAYLNNNIYIKWGDPYFWRKLKYALPYSSSG